MDDGEALYVRGEVVSEEQLVRVEVSEDCLGRWRGVSQCVGLEVDWDDELDCTLYQRRRGRLWMDCVSRSLGNVLGVFVGWARERR